MPKWPVHARIDGPIVLIGFGSIGKGTLPLIERHFSYDKKRFVVIDPEDKDRKLLDQRGIRFIHQAVTKDNYRHLLTPLLTAGGGDMGAKAAFLRIARRIVIVIVETGFAERHHFRRAAARDKIGRSHIQFLMGVMRMRADRAKNIGKALGDCE